MTYLTKLKLFYLNCKRTGLQLKRKVIGFVQQYLFNFIFLFSSLKSVYMWSAPVCFLVPLTNSVYARFLQFFVVTKLKMVYSKTRYIIWLSASLPWKLRNDVVEPISETTSYPYSWLRATDICNILYKNTNFFQICAEQQTLLDVQLKERLPYYLYLTKTEHLLGQFPKQFLLDLEPYYYRLVIQSLHIEHQRDPLVYVRFAIDPHFRQLLFTHLANEYYALAKHRLTDVPFSEFITQRFSTQAELQAQLKIEIPVSSNFTTLVELTYTFCIEHFYLYYILGTQFTLKEILQFPIGQSFSRIDQIFSHAIPIMYCVGLLLGIIYYQFILLEYSDDKIHLVKWWWVKVKYFFFTTFNLDIQSKDRDLLFLFMFYGVAPYYHIKYILTFKINDLRKILLEDELPIHPSGTMLETNSPIYSESPVLFFMVQSDARNVYYRTGFNRAVVRNPNFRESEVTIPEPLPLVLDLYPARNVSTLRFIEPVRTLETERYSDMDSLSVASIFSGFSGYHPLLTHIGGRHFFQNGKMPEQVITTSSIETHIAKKLLEISPFCSSLSFNHITQSAFLYKSYREASRFLASLTITTEPESTPTSEIIEPLDDILYGSSEFFENYENYEDSCGGEKSFQFAINELKKYPQHLLQKRGQCLYYHSLKDIMSHYPKMFSGIVEVGAMHTSCDSFYKPLMTNVLADLASKKKPNRTIIDLFGFFFKDLLFYTEGFLRLNLNGIVTENPSEYLFTYKELYKTLKETPHLVVLELLNSEWFDFRINIDPSLNFEQIYLLYEYQLLEKLRSRVELRSYANHQTQNEEHFSETHEDMRSKTLINENQVPMPADTIILSQNLLRHMLKYLESKEISRQTDTQLLGNYSHVLNLHLKNFPTTKKYQELLSTKFLNPLYHSRRRLFYTPFTDFKHNFTLELRTDALIKKYLTIYANEQRVIPGKLITYEKVYKKYDYEAQFAHDVSMDFEVFNHINKYGIAGDKLFKQGLDAMIRRWGQNDPFIQKIQDLYKTARLDAFIELDPHMTKELDAKLKLVNCSVAQLYNMSFSEFKYFLDQHRVPTWLIEASILEKLVYGMTFDEQYERSAALVDNRCFVAGDPLQAPVYTYTLDDIIAVQENRLVSWDNQLAAINETSIEGDIELESLNKTHLLDDETLPETTRKVYGPPLRHLKFLEMYDPRDSAYQRQILEVYMFYMTTTLIDQLFPTWASSRVFDLLEIRYTGTSPFLDEFDLRLHNLLQRLEKQFGLAKELTGYKTKTGRYICGPKLVEYCELFKFFENIDILLPKLLVGFSKNDDELDLTLETFTTYLQPQSTLIHQYELNLPKSALYKDPKMAYQIYAPFTFEELVLFSQKYENTFYCDYATAEFDFSLDVIHHVNRTYLRVICNEDQLASRKYFFNQDYSKNEKTKYNIPEYLIVNSIFPSRDKAILDYALTQKYEHAERILNYNMLYTESIPVRRRPLKLLADTKQRFLNIPVNVNESLNLYDVKDRFLKGTSIEKRLVRYNPDMAQRQQINSLAEGFGEKSVILNYPIQNNILIFPKRIRRIHTRNQNLYRVENLLFQRNMQRLKKDRYLQYILSRVESVRPVSNIYNPNLFVVPTMRQVQRRQLAAPIFRQICNKQLDQKVYDERFRKYLAKATKYKQKLVFIEYNNDLGIKTNAQTATLQRNFETKTSYEVRNWIIVDYVNFLARIRKETTELVQLEKALDFGLTRSNMWSLRTSMLHVYKTLIIKPRVRVLTGFLHALSGKQFWLPEISPELIRELELKKDIVILEDLFYILNALNHAADNKKLRSNDFTSFFKAHKVDVQNPKLFLLDRVERNQYYPQEILAELALHNLVLVEKIIRIRRVLEIEYNIKTELFDSLIVDVFSKSRNFKKISIKLGNLKQHDFQFLYFLKNKRYIPIVPRLVFYETEEHIVRSIVHQNLRKTAHLKYDLYRIPIEEFHSFSWRYLKLNILKPPILIIPDMRKFERNATRWRAQALLMFSSRLDMLRYNYYKNLGSCQRSHFYLERLFIRYYTSLYKDVYKKEALLTQTTNTIKNTNKPSGVLLSFLIPISKTNIDADTIRTNLVKTIDNYLDQCKNVWTRLQPTLQDRLITYKLNKLITKYQKYPVPTNSDIWGVFFMPDSTRRIKLSAALEYNSDRRLAFKELPNTKGSLCPTQTTALETITPLPSEDFTRENIISYNNFNHLNDMSIHNLLDEIILTGFYSIPSPKLSDNFYKYLLFTGLELSTGKPNFGIWLNWSYGKPVKLWFPIFNNQSMQLSNGAPGLIFLPRLTSYISEDNIIEVSSRSIDTSTTVTKPFLEHKTTFSFLRWSPYFKEKELWLQFFIYERFHLLPGDFFYDILFNFFLYQITIWDLFFKI